MKNEVVLTKEEIADGVAKINHALLSIGLRCNEGDVGYETLYTDDRGETQGGWYAEFDKKSRDKLRESKQVSWRNTGMIGGDTLDDILKVIASLKFRNYKKDPTPLQLKMAENIQNKVDATKAALAVFNSGEPLPDDALRLCLAHFKDLDRLCKTDATLTVLKPYVNVNLSLLERYKEARKRK